MDRDPICLQPDLDLNDNILLVITYLSHFVPVMGTSKRGEHIIRRLDHSL